MKRSTEITTLFLDVGGVLLTNGWDHHARALAAKAFDLNLEEMEDRHHLTFDTYEEGKLTLEEYLTRTVWPTCHRNRYPPSSSVLPKRHRTKKADAVDHPLGIRPRRLTLQRAPRQSRVALHLVIRRLQTNQ